MISLGRITRVDVVTSSLASEGPSVQLFSLGEAVVVALINWFNASSKISLAVVVSENYNKIENHNEIENYNFFFLPFLCENSGAILVCNVSYY